MVVRKRIRAVLIPLVGYCIAGAVVSYFVEEARHGARGLETKGEYQQEIAKLRDEYEALKSERNLWQHRVSLLKSDSVDRDLLVEEAHTLLDRFDPRELVIFVDKPATK